MDISSITRGSQSTAMKAITEHAQRTVPVAQSQGSEPPGRADNASDERAAAVRVADRSAAELEVAAQLTALRAQSGTDAAAMTAKMTNTPAAAAGSIGVAASTPVNVVVRGPESVVAVAVKGVNPNATVDNSVHRHQGVVEPNGVTGNGSPVVEGLGFDLRA